MNKPIVRLSVIRLNLFCNPRNYLSINTMSLPANHQIIGSSHSMQMLKIMEPYRWFGTDNICETVHSVSEVHKNNIYSNGITTITINVYHSGWIVCFISFHTPYLFALSLFAHHFNSFFFVFFFSIRVFAIPFQMR